MRRGSPSAIVRALLCAACLVMALISPAKALALDSEPYVGEAYAAIVCDQAGNVLWERNAYETMAPASITKVMTAMVALDAWGDDLDTACTIYDIALPSDAQFAGYQAGDSPTRRELLQAMLVYSANEAASNVALNVCGSEAEFCQLMNEKAQALGMNNTSFANPHGLEQDGHWSCARDLMVMGRYALLHYPFIAQTVRLEGVDAYPGGTYRWLRSTDEMKLWYEGLLGIKTGAVASGTTFLGASQRDGVALFTCVLGCDTDEGRFADTASIMDWAYATFWRPGLPSAGRVASSSPSSLLPGLRVVTRVPYDLGYQAWPVGELGYTTVALPHGTLTSPYDLAQVTSWRQEGRLAGATFVWHDAQPTTTPAINPFAVDILAGDAA